MLACLGTFHSTAPQGSFSIPDTDAMAEALVLDHNLSILASDPETGTLQCVMLNGVFHRDEISGSKFIELLSRVKSSFWQYFLLLLTQNLYENCDFVTLL